MARKSDPAYDPPVRPVLAIALLLACLVSACSESPPPRREPLTWGESLREWRASHEESLRAELGSRTLSWFDPDESYRVTASYTIFDRPIAHEPLGNGDDTPSAVFTGEVAFLIDGERHTLMASKTDPDVPELFIMFGDLTNRDSTYPSGRYLTVPLDYDRAVLDFNRAVSPLCAVDPEAICPVPPAKKPDEPARRGGRAPHRRRGALAPTLAPAPHPRLGLGQRTGSGGR